jgi:DNA-binding XRE family transcriptional regulator
MPKAKKFRDLVARMPVESRERSEALTRQLLEDMPLQALRRALTLTQDQLAESTGLTQSGIAQIEQRSDVFVSTLRRYIEAMGGELIITARFPFGETRISQFGPTAEQARRGALGCKGV